MKTKPKLQTAQPLLLRKLSSKGMGLVERDFPNKQENQKTLPLSKSQMNRLEKRKVLHRRIWAIKQNHIQPEQQFRSRRSNKDQQDTAIGSTNEEFDIQTTSK